ncbi:MAG: carboxypeptidase-like regulatory domain-containing protein [Prolixibacteraceae bacterium]
MLRILFSMLLFFSCYSVWAQSMLISGFVRDSISNEPLIGASIWNEGTREGTISDHFGHYSIVVDQTSKLKVAVSFIGYKTKTIDRIESERVDFSLSPGIDLDEVRIVENSINSERNDFGVISIPIKLLKEIPILGEPDVLKAMQFMPGIQGGAEGRSGLYVRGGSLDQNLILLDGSPIYYMNHYGNFLSLFHPEIISNVKLYKGASPAKYGGRLSSVVDLRMRQGNRKEHHGSLGIGLLSADILLEGPIKKDTTSYIFSARRFYLDAIMRPAYYLLTEGRFSVGYNFYDIYGKIDHSINEDNRLYFSLYKGNDSFGTFINPWGEQNLDGKSQTNWGNLLTSIRLNSQLSNRLLSDLIVAYSRYQSGELIEMNTDSTFKSHEQKSIIQNISIKSEFIYKVNKWYEFSSGAGLSFQKFHPGQSINSNSVGGIKMEDDTYNVEMQYGLDPYLFIENVLNPTDFLKLNLGFRYAGSLVKDTYYQKIQPRFIALLGTEKTGFFKCAYSENMQPLHLLSRESIGTPNDQWVPATNQISPAIAKQFSVGYSRYLLNNFEFSVEAYVKHLSNLIDYKDGTSYWSTEGDWQNNVETGGQGVSKGVEILVKKNNGKTTGWLSYTLAKTDRYFENKNSGNWYPFIYDRRHDFSLVLNHKFNEKYTLSASWVFGSGYPITLETGYYQTYQLDYKGDVSSASLNPFELDEGMVIYSEKNGVRLGNSHRLDLGFQIHGTTKKGRDKTWSFNIYNVYNQQNPAYYYYDWVNHKDHSQGKDIYQQSGIPIVPSFTYRVKW